VKVDLAKTFPLPGAPDAAWKVLQDVEAVASCMPGAKITQRIDETHYKGTVTVRVGPATLSFRGDIEVKEIDAATRTLRLVASGSDTAGSAGSMELTARIDGAEDGRSMLNGQSVVSLSGKAATFGGRMVNSVADQILGQFAGHFAARVPATPASGASAQATSVADGGSSAAATSASAVAATSPAAASNAPTPAAPVSAQPLAAELNGLALLWAVIRDWLRGLFAGRRA
jgi:carbon monoxide dehydrogenase subunit G